MYLFVDLILEELEAAEWYYHASDYMVAVTKYGPFTSPGVKKEWVRDFKCNIADYPCQLYEVWVEDDHGERMFLAPEILIESTAYFGATKEEADIVNMPF